MAAILEKGVSGIALEADDRTVLCVRIHSAEKLKDSDFFSKNDPYVVITFGGCVSQSLIYREGGSDVHFDWLVHFQDYKGGDINRDVEVSVWDEDSGRLDDLLGKCTVDLGSEEMEKTLYSTGNGNKFVHSSNTSPADRLLNVVQFEKELLGGKNSKMVGQVTISIWRRTYADYLSVGTEVYQLKPAAIKNSETMKTPTSAAPVQLPYPPDGQFVLPYLWMNINHNRSAGFVLKFLDGGTLDEFNTYQIKLWYVSEIFGNDRKQEWNKSYDNAVKIFGNTNSATLIRAGIRTEHGKLYDKRNVLHGKSSGCHIEGLGDFLTCIGYKKSDFIKPCGQAPQKHLDKSGEKFTYAITPDNQLYFSKTAVSKVQKGRDFLSKHALHANVSTHVVYAGEFFVDTKSEHVIGTKRLRLIIDNNSGTYGPKKEDLGRLKRLFDANFGVGSCLALHWEDEELKALKIANHVE